MMPITLGTYATGERYARAYFSGDSYSVTVEGKGTDDETATEQLVCNIRKLGVICDGMADEMMIVLPDDEAATP